MEIGLKLGYIISAGIIVAALASAATREQQQTCIEEILLNDDVGMLTAYKNYVNECNSLNQSGCILAKERLVLRMFANEEFIELSAACRYVVE